MQPPHKDIIQKSKQPQIIHPKYRTDIDGLRAIAVIAVVAFHAFPSWLKGGFIGVDIFFIISGYLISTIIFESLDKGTFSFSGFYTRRIKRIFPALIVVLIACLVIGWNILLADEYKQLGKHIAAGASFISNLTLWNEAGYFDSAADTKPLLHLWSLGIEEQFYIVWPLLLWLSWKCNFNFLLITILATITSFALNVYGVKNDPVATFYSPQTRFWELLSGSFLAWMTLYKKTLFFNIANKINNCIAQPIHRDILSHGELPASILSFIGLFILAYGFWKIDKNLIFPGEWALVPVIGTVFLLGAGAKGFINRTILSNKLVVWIGLISFPLYLWHWPLLSFARIVEGEEPSIRIRITAVILAFLLASLTYKVVERPIRFGKHGKLKTSLLIILMSLVGFSGYQVFIRNGIENRFQKMSMVDPETALALASNNCSVLFPKWAKLTDNPCRLQKQFGNTIAIIGDSHAGHLYVGMSESLGDKGGVADFAASCAAPYLDIASGTSEPNTTKMRGNAYRLINSAYEYIFNDSTIRTVILAHRPLCSYGDAKDIANPSITSANDALEDGMRRTFSALRKSHKNVIVLFDNPQLPFEPSACIQRPFRLANQGKKCSFPRSYFDSLEAYGNYKSLVNKVIKDFPEVHTLDLSETLCDDRNCYLVKNSQPLYLDRGHLNYNGSRYVAPYIMDSINLFN